MSYLPGGKDLLIQNGDGGVVRLAGCCNGVGDVVEGWAGVVVLGYSKLFRARRIRPNERKTCVVEPNWAMIASWTATCPPRLVARSPWMASRLAALFRSAS